VIAENEAFLIAGQGNAGIYTNPPINPPALCITKPSRILMKY